jgi:hypothetical protein
MCFYVTLSKSDKKVKNAAQHKNNAVMPSVVMLIVVAPLKKLYLQQRSFSFCNVFPTG